MKLKFLVSLTTQLCHVKLFWKLSCDVIRGHTVFCWKQTLERMFRKNIDGTSQTLREWSCIAMLCNWSLLFCTSQRVVHKWTHGILSHSGLHPLPCANLLEHCSFFWIVVALQIHVWCLLLIWTAGILKRNSGITWRNYDQIGPLHHSPINLLTY